MKASLVFKPGGRQENEARADDIVAGGRLQEHAFDREAAGGESWIVELVGEFLIQQGRAPATEEGETLGEAGGAVRFQDKGLGAGDRDGADVVGDFFVRESVIARRALIPFRVGIGFGSPKGVVDADEIRGGTSRSDLAHGKRRSRRGGRNGERAALLEQAQVGRAIRLQIFQILQTGPLFRSRGGGQG